MSIKVSNRLKYTPTLLNCQNIENIYYILSTREQYLCLQSTSKHAIVSLKTNIPSHTVVCSKTES